jgi:hypothetical protein
VREDEIYVAAKALLRKEGWRLLAGQPPAGSDHLPVVEIKDPLREGLGSRGAFKPDLIAHRSGTVLICECKPLYDRRDEAKLLSVLSSPGRLAELELELRSRGLWARHGIEEPESGFVYQGALAHAGPILPTPLITISVGAQATALIPPFRD